MNFEVIAWTNPHEGEAAMTLLAFGITILLIALVAAIRHHEIHSLHR